ncbi:MAG: hypothetical protein ABSB89_08745 [Candidatus Bathyarchaeia archaeon]
MSSDIVQFPIAYVIITTSDWTRVQIVEGGYWTDHNVECTEGQDALTDLLYNRRTILIQKNLNDARRVVASMKCVLNIAKEYSESNVTYRITKGDLGSTVVRVIANSVESQIVHATKIPNDPKNPFFFNFPAQQYLQHLEKKEEIGKLPKETKEESKPEKEEHFITLTFNAMFKETFQKKEPTENDVKEVFEWIGSQGETATKLLEADICKSLALNAETHFYAFPNLKKKLHEESKNAHEKIKKRYDDLRKIEGEVSVQAQAFGVKKAEKRVAPNK